MSVKPLSEIKKNEIGIIQDIEGGKLAIRLMEMGCVMGEQVKLKATAPFGDPIAIDVAGYSLSLRKKDAFNIKIKIVECL